MIEIRIHGRAGQGVVTAAEILAEAAFDGGKFSQAFPAFGMERRGAPVQAFTRIDEKAIRNRSQIYNPDYVIIQDPSLIPMKEVGVLSGLKEDGMVVVNSEKSLEEIGLPSDIKVRTVPASKIAIEILGRPIMNTTLIGAFAGATKLIELPSVEKSLKRRFREQLVQRNMEAITRAYTMMENER